LALQTGLLQARRHLAEIAARRHLERQPRRVDGAAALQHDRLQAGFGGEDGAVLFPRGEAQAHDAGEVIDGSLDVGRRQRRMAGPFDLKHGILPMRAAQAGTRASLGTRPASWARTAIFSSPSTGAERQTMTSPGFTGPTPS